ncbi:MBL fold metallo-hydrolase [Candidatus Lucifugimonas marina]|uniref:MBL fold metallo-hydrolase n=1 Tax=Candidatus Lucifugimonas marina TaxID=3038979 RepID=A0AAJ5ZJ06_9CHLR|nr:MBL fold metallo-hydrolase [SAR202 cluster bacterium JH639]WFG35686.1 MBL fold metallo-hydrolase [SAR202 cluster bacterium JH545]WFG39632.1 MBL fold metallo-hydrolase [SAR202 cluster bacterium JH1073]
MVDSALPATMLLLLQPMSNRADELANLIVLGSGGPIPNADRFGTSHVVTSGGRNFLFDCGPATTYKLAKHGLSSLDFDHLFISHHHFDHVADLPAFLLTRWDHSIGDETPLKIFGPENTEVMIERLVGEQGAFAFDWKARINHPLSQQMHQLRGGALPRPKPEFDVSDVSTGVILEGDGFRVTSQRIEHVEPQLQANAYRLDTDDISIVFTGDARPCDHIIDLASDADVLVSMCGNFQSELERKGVQSGQIGSLSAAEMAAEAGVGQLVMVHMGPDISSASGRVRALEEMSSIFQGEIIVSDELSSYDLRRRDVSANQNIDNSMHAHICRDM